MTSRTRPPKYPHQPIRSLRALAAALQTSLQDLQRVAQASDRLYRSVSVPKTDGTKRDAFDAYPELKAIQKRIQRRLLVHVQYPDYLTGSLKGRDARRNATLHANAAIVACEDVQSFFPSVSSALVEEIWKRFFGFAPDVAALLTALTTRCGSLPQGAVTSSYLANLAFWSKEPELQRLLALRGITYSRYVDDITISSRQPLGNKELAWCISQIYGMLASCGMKPKRRKHEVWRRHGRMFVTKLLVNARPALPDTERQAIRAAVFQMERQVQSGVCSERAAFEMTTRLARLTGRVSRLGQMHPTEAKKLKARIAVLRNIIKSRRCSRSAVTV